MGVHGGARSPVRSPTRQSRAGWVTLTLAGAAAFWVTNLLISLTPWAADYRSALSIDYVPMLLEALVGGLVVAGVVTFALLRFGARVPGGGPVRRSLFLAGCALVVLTALVEVPAKLGADLVDPGRWLGAASVINAIRLLALGLTIGLAARATGTGAADRRPAGTKEES